MSKLIYSLKSNSEKDNERHISSPKKPLFNSKLFIDLELDKEIEDLNNDSENNTEDSDNSLNVEEINYLSNELIILSSSFFIKSLSPIKVYVILPPCFIF